MAGDQEVGAGKRYVIGNVAAGARIIQGDYNTWVESVQAQPGGEELKRQVEELLARIADATELDDDDRQLATEKTKAVVVALGQAEQDPEGLRKALRDARVLLTTSVHWAWEGLCKVLQSEAAQMTISSIAEAGTRAAIQGLIGPS
jgi:hypothetical protein